MANLRVIYSNAADQATLTASTTSGSLVAANMLNERKASVHRSTLTAVAYTMTWGSPQTVGGVALPATNLTQFAKIRVRLYSDQAGTELVADSGQVYACPTSTVGLYDWGGPVDVNAFAYGGASKSAVWFKEQPTNVRRCVVEISDPRNPAGYIDCARLVVGPFWEGRKNADYGATAGTTDMSKVQRSDSGDSFVQRGPQYQTMSLNLSDLNEQDRAALAKIVRSHGNHRNIFVSLLPEYPRELVELGLGDGGLSSGLEGDLDLGLDGLDLQVSGLDLSLNYPDASVAILGDASAEQDHMIYGKRASAPFSFDYFNSFSTRVEVEGW